MQEDGPVSRQCVTDGQAQQLITMNWLLIQPCIIENSR